MTISVGNLETSSSFNSIQTTIADVLGPGSTGYGYSFMSTQVTQGSLIALSDWQNLYTDVARAYAHQTDQNLPLPIPSQGSVITAALANMLSTYAAICSTNRYQAANQQLSSSSVNATSNRLSAWGNGSEIIHQVTYTWDSQSEMNYFFNLGGQVTPTMSYGVGNSSEDLAVKSLIDRYNAQMGANSYAHAQYSQVNPNYSSPLVQDLDGLGNQIRFIETAYAVSGSTLTATTIIYSANSVDLTVENIFYTFTSINTASPTGIAALPPATVTTIDLNTNGPVIPYEAPTVRLSVSPSSYSYGFNANSTSTAQAVTLINYGNIACTVTNITFVSSQQYSPIVTGLASRPITIAPSSSTAFNLAYTSNYTGFFNSGGTVNTNFSIASNNDKGSVTVPVSLTISPIQFSYSVSPTSISATVSDLNVYSQQVIITGVNGSYSSYSASVATPYFSVTTTSLAGPVVNFLPLTAPSNGTYTDTLTLTVNGITVTVPISINFTAAVNNIGNWISALGEANSVVGISYDYIGGTRYVTIGLGMGADGSNQLSAGGSSFVNVNNLNYLADNNYGAGVALYPSPLLNVGSGTFLKQYGVWIRNSDSGPHNVLLTRSYTVNVSRSGTYNYNFGSYGTAFVYVNGGLVVSVDPNVGVVTGYSGNLTLNSGVNTIVLQFKSDIDNNSGIAFQITDPNNGGSTVWSTLTPVRSTNPYAYWAEVYRVPLTGSAATYNISQYIVKDTAPDSYNNSSYGSNFLNGYATISDDGNGNITITNSSLALQSYPDTETLYTYKNLLYAFYYYEESQGAPRYTNLTDATANYTCPYFTGFKKDGTVVTTTVPYPRNRVSEPGGGYPGYQTQTP
jgi:hypothetical protein